MKTYSGKLLEICDLLAASPKIKTYHFLKSLNGIDHNSQIYNALIQFKTLVSNSEMEMKRSKITEKNYKSFFKTLYKSIENSFLSIAGSEINIEDLERFRLIAEVIESYEKPTILLQVKDLNIIKTQILDFKKDLEKLSISDSLNKVILACLSRMERAIYDYEIFGVEKFDESIKTILGEIMVSQNVNEKDKPVAKKFFDLFMHFVTNFDKVIGLGLKIDKIKQIDFTG